MRLIVFSDSHRNFTALYRIVEMHPHAGMYLHLGDGEAEFSDLAVCFPELDMRFVRGNNDWASDAPDTLLLECAGKRVMMTHGHAYGVKSGLARLLLEARRQAVDIVLYGHTHTAYTHVEDGLHIMNPGSVSLPMGGPPSYGVIDITDSGIHMQLLPLGRV